MTAGQYVLEEESCLKLLLLGLLTAIIIAVEIVKCWEIVIVSHPGE